ncbi:2-dehydropantoate 2-reductase [Geobacter pickeringii]|uniref:2-dehydropantoate 2-reductase n=1 Tax=Geobacter pickeringii TaxID=345632 RepID=A0A0B5BD73_9BACT|nr:2-dehydropantoate 2-reductase [Geobacter pickeringii]AJE03054.1 2-dehydropantoate 2-reductase [Geobacter pickeringii]
MRIAIVGAGALGLYYGALLQRGGNDVRFLLRRDYDAIMAGGLRVFSTGGDFHLARVAGFRRPEEIGEVDLVVVGLKAFVNDRYAELVAPLVGRNTLILTLQNGLGNEEGLAALFGPDRIFGGVAFLCSNRGVPGEVHHLGAGRILLGALCSEKMAEAEMIATVFRSAGIDCSAVSDLRKARWEKLVWNIPFNGICALTGRTVADVLSSESGSRLARNLMAEVIAAANAQGLSEPLAADFAARMITFSAGLGPYRPSMMIDREEGRPLELEAIFAIPLERGAMKGVPMPCVETLAGLLGLAVAVAP